MDALTSCDIVFVLDAVLGGGRGGRNLSSDGSDLRKSLSFRDSMHQTDLADTLIFCELIGKRPEAVVLGMEPEDYMSMGTELSPTARKRLPLLCGLLRDELTAPRPDADGTPDADRAFPQNGGHGNMTAAAAPADGPFSASACIPARARRLPRLDSLFHYR